MGASKDRKRRKEEISSGNSLKMQHLREEEEKARKSRNKYIAGGIIIAVLAIFILVFSSPLLYRDVKAVDINGRAYSAADYKYYNRSLYWQYYSKYNSNSGEYAQYLMPDETRLKEEAFDTMKELTMLTSEAEKAGFEFTEDMQAQVDSNVDAIVKSYTQAGYANLDSYLASAYGKGVNEEVYRENLKNVVYGNSYADSIRESYDFSSSEIESYYKEHADDYDSVNYRYFFINGAAQEGGDSTATMGQAKTVADEFVAAAVDEQAFIAKALELASEDQKETYADASATLRSSKKADMGDMGDWLFDSSRQPGDVTAIESDSGYAVLFYIDRETNHYNTVDVRHILISPELPDRNTYDDDETYNADAEKAYDAAYDRAEEILKE
ncbi:MAG: SurA N-terminal domain-containing protein, partial [Oscillospiraceae bacterium]|nr:SurA N-terminal domain-containing protein [Oscillospiraceae bacterium]